MTVSTKMPLMVILRKSNNPFLQYKIMLFCFFKLKCRFVCYNFVPLIAVLTSSKNLKSKLMCEPHILSLLVTLNGVYYFLYFVACNAEKKFCAWMARNTNHKLFSYYIMGTLFSHCKYRNVVGPIPRNQPRLVSWSMELTRTGVKLPHP